MVDLAAEAAGHEVPATDTASEASSKEEVTVKAVDVVQHNVPSDTAVQLPSVAVEVV